MQTNKLDLIDRNALYEKAYFHGKLPDPGCLYPDGKEAVDVDDIDDAPTVDAVEVIRCEGCEFFNPDENIMPQSGTCEYHEMVKMFWDFCSRGKRRSS